jgi:hypothetical protein
LSIRQQGLLVAESWIDQAGPEPFPLPPGSTGGQAKLRVSLSSGQTGVLTIFCVLGSPPPSKMEGIQLILGGAVSSESITIGAGNTVFIAIWAGGDRDRGSAEGHALRPLANRPVTLASIGGR